MPSTPAEPNFLRHRQWMWWMIEPEPASASDASEPDGVGQLAWPVGAVADRLGVAASTLRSWDRRHGIGPTSRTGGRHRRYSESDIRRVALMARLTAHGIPAQAAADALQGMDDAAVTARLGTSSSGAVNAGERGPGAGGGAPAEPDDQLRSPATANAHHRATDRAPAEPAAIDAIVRAAGALDGHKLSTLYRQALRQYDVAGAWGEVFVPALQRIGELWARGEAGVEVEHLASELLQSELRGVSRANRLRLVGPPVMLANADNEMHHLPLLALEAGLAGRSVASLFLGPRLPTEALIDAVLRTRPQVLFLWASLSRRHREPLWEGLSLIDWSLTVVVGGPGWPKVMQHHNPHVTLRKVGDFVSAVDLLVEVNTIDGGHADPASR